MELKHIIKKLKIKRQLLAVGALIGSIMGACVFFLPKKYTAQGSFFINRDIQLSQDGSFSYEGYYSQQVAISSTKTVAALIESPDLGYRVLTKLNQNITAGALRNYRAKTKVTAIGPQLLTLTVKAATSETAATFWNAIAESLVASLGSSLITITKTSDNPIVLETHKNLPLFMLVGSITGISCAVSIITIKEYLKD